MNEIRNLNMGVSLGSDLCVSILIYADIILLVENLQCMLNYLYNWCTNRRRLSNCDKTKIVDFENKQQCPVTSFFSCMGKSI